MHERMLDEGHCIFTPLYMILYMFKLWTNGRLHVPRLPAEHITTSEEACVSALVRLKLKTSRPVELSFLEKFPRVWRNGWKRIQSQLPPGTKRGLRNDLRGLCHA